MILNINLTIKKCIHVQLRGFPILLLDLKQILTNNIFWDFLWTRYGWYGNDVYVLPFQKCRNISRKYNNTWFLLLMYIRKEDECIAKHSCLSSRKAFKELKNRQWLEIVDISNYLEGRKKEEEVVVKSTKEKWNCVIMNN